VVDLSLGLDLDLSRWFSDNEASLASISALNSDIEITEVSGLPALVNRQIGKMALFSHPLWSLEKEFWNELQIKANTHAKSVVDEVEFINIFDIDRKPITVFQIMQTTN
jgi:hypothetical protein